MDLPRAEPAVASDDLLCECASELQRTKVHDLGTLVGGVAGVARPSRASGEDSSTSTTAGSQAEVQSSSNPNQVRDLSGLERRRDCDGMDMQGLRVRSTTESSRSSDPDVKGLSVAGR